MAEQLAVEVDVKNVMHGARAAAAAAGQALLFDLDSAKHDSNYLEVPPKLSPK